MPQQRIMELKWQNGQILVVNASKRSPEEYDDYHSAIDLQFKNKDELNSLLPCPPDEVSELYYPRPPTLLSTPYNNRDELLGQTEFASTSASLLPVHPVKELELEPTVVLPSREPRVVLVADNMVQVSRGNRLSRGIEVVKSAVTSSPGLGGIGSVGAEPSKKRTSSTDDVKQKGIEANDEPRKKRASAKEDLKRKGIEANNGPSKKRMSTTVDLKRKGIETNDDECPDEVVEFEYADGRKQIHKSGSSKKSRDSERKRRDRINKYMKALQELIPGYNKNDKASMLCDAIEYVKSLQLQVQMIGTSTGLGINVGMNPTMVPFPYVPGGYPAATVPHMPPRFDMPPSLMWPPPDPSRIQQTNQSADVHYAQAQWAQNQEDVQPYTYNNREVVDRKNHQSASFSEVCMLRQG